MAGASWIKAVPEVGDGAIEIVGELRLAEDQLQLRHGDQRLAYGIAVSAQPIGHLQQDAVDFLHLLLGEAHQFVVEVDRLQRLHKQRVPAGTGGMNHAIDLAALSGDHRDDEALIADGDEFLLQDAFLAVGAQETLERLVDGLLLALDVAAQAAQRDARMVGHAAIWQDLAIQFAQQGAKLADGGGAASQQRKALGGRGQVRLGIGGDIEQGEQLEDFLGLEPRAFDAQFVYRGFHVGDAAELDAQRGAAPAGLRVQGGVQVVNRLSGFGERGVELRAVRKRAHLFQFAFAQRARDVAAKELPQSFEFQDFSACFQDGYFLRIASHARESFEREYVSSTQRRRERRDKRRENQTEETDLRSSLPVSHSPSVFSALPLRSL